MGRPMKRVADSITQQTQVVISSDLNGYGRLFGGRLMQWIDVVAGVVARRHFEGQVTTASIDHLEFLIPAYSNDLIILIGYMTWVGTCSMEIRVDSYREDPQGNRTLMNRAYAVMVGLGEDERPAPTPGLIVETEKEKLEWAAAEQRQTQRKNLRETEREIERSCR